MEEYPGDRAGSRIGWVGRLVLQQNVSNLSEQLEDRVRARRERRAVAEELLGLGHRHSEHHQAVIVQADLIIDLGAGYDDGSIVLEGTPGDLVAGRSTLKEAHLAADAGA